MSAPVSSIFTPLWDSSVVRSSGTSSSSSSGQMSAVASESLLQLDRANLRTSEIEQPSTSLLSAANFPAALSALSDVSTSLSLAAASSSNVSNNHSLPSDDEFNGSLAEVSDFVRNEITLKAVAEVYLANVSKSHMGLVKPLIDLKN